MNELKYTPQLSNKSKSVKFLNQDFDGFRDNLIKFLKANFKDTIKDFSPASSGMMLIELNSYVGEVLAFYLNRGFNELFLDSAVDKKNILNRSKLLGYKPIINSTSITTIDVYCIVPAILENSIYIPDSRYFPYIAENMKLQSMEGGIYFETTDYVDFSININSSPRTDVVYEYSISGVPSKFLCKKSVNAISGESKTYTYTANDPTSFLKILIPDENVIDVLSVSDSDGNTWDEVEYLAQDTVFYELKNNSITNTEYIDDSSNVPYLLNTKFTNKRYTIERDHEGNVYIRFGAGVAYNSDDEIVINPYLHAGIPILGYGSKNYPIDPNNYMQTRTLGEVPFNTTLTIKYRKGGGFGSNIGVNSIKKIISANTSLVTENNILTQSTKGSVFSSITVNNSKPAVGGTDSIDFELVKEYASSFFAAQNRVVTTNDYIARVMSMPGKYGSVAKAFVSPTNYKNNDFVNDTKMSMNPYGINLFVLSYDSSKKLIKCPLALKKNISTYLSKYRMLTDGINIIDGKIINIQVKFSVISFNSYNKPDLLTKCISEISDYFDISKWRFNQSISLSEISYILHNVEGVQSVKNVSIENIYGGEYSNSVYDIKSNTNDNIIYPSSQISIFEVKYPERDILGSIS